VIVATSLVLLPLPFVHNLPGFTYFLTDNRKLNETNADFQAPLVTFSTITSDGYELNVKEMRPPGLDESGRVRYPVLFKVYGLHTTESSQAVTLQTDAFMTGMAVLDLKRFTRDSSETGMTMSFALSNTSWSSWTDVEPVSRVAS
jgi:hypothetical protein